MRLTDITRLRRAEVFVTLGGVAWMRGVSVLRKAGYCSIVIGDGFNRSLRGNNPNIINSLVPYSGQDRRCYFIVINNGPIAG